MAKYTPEETKAHRDLWIEALRSGEYEQATGRLYVSPLDASAVAGYTKPGHCCLGVACEVAMREGVILGYHPSGSELPEEVAEWLGITTSGAIESDETIDQVNALDVITLNDDRGWTFEQIADLVDAEELVSW